MVIFTGVVLQKEAVLQIKRDGINLEFIFKISSKTYIESKHAFVGK